jgi:putative flavoprotein involved in K+ transport
MTIEQTETLIVGAGQAGLAMSEHLGLAGRSHLILERDRIVERWRTARWDSLVANGPAWHDRFPSLLFKDIDPDAFPSKNGVVEYFTTYAEHINAPIRCGVEVLQVSKNLGRPGFTVKTSEGIIEATNVVAATGPFQTPIIPPLVPETASLVQIHSNAYRNPEQLPEGAVLVVGAGSSGSQIADELLRSGKSVYLSVGAHDRPPRSYRGRDFVWWLGVLGKWDAAALAPGTQHVTIAVSGAHGGITIDFRQFAKRGMTLMGLTEGFNEGVIKFAPDLRKNVCAGDANYLSLLEEADAYIERNGLDLPEEPAAKFIDPDPDCLSNPIFELDLAKAGVTSIIWATGYASDYGWLDVDTLDSAGKPIHERGISSEPGIYFLGLPWQSRRGSSFIWGVWHDAKYVAEHICKQRSYWDYHDGAAK